MCVCVCVCVCCSLNTAADQAQDPVDSQLAGQSVSHCEGCCSVVLDYLSHFLPQHESLLGCSSYFFTPPSALSYSRKM